MNDIKLVESNEQPMKNHLLSSHERIRSIYWAIELELRGWDIRSAFGRGNGICYRVCDFSKIHLRQKRSVRTTSFRLV